MAAMAERQDMRTEIDPSGLDYRMFSQRDLTNMVLQRSDVLSDVPRPGRLINAWSDGDGAPLKAAVKDRGIIFAQRAARMIQTEFELLKPILDPIAPKKIADIGCGYGMFDLFAHARYGSDLLLIDIEQSDHRHFGFKSQAAAYTSLSSAKAFLTQNGVPAARVTTWNPESEDIDPGTKPDVAVSFLSCGFHFPVDMYAPFFRFGVAPGGTIILDLRNQTYREGLQVLEKLGHVEELHRVKNRRRVVVRKGKR
ncbi:MAG: class I SAM-dependent methyltransferase [Pseudomonadota bacterium]